MTSPLDLLAPETYSRRDPRTLMQVLKGGQDLSIDAANANGVNRGRDIANDESQMTLEENLAMHPAILAQIQQEAQKGQQAPALPPPMQGAIQQPQPAPGPQPAPAQPFMLGQGAPSQTGSSMTGQPSAAPDPYAPKQSLLDEGQQLADWEKGHPVMLAKSEQMRAIQAQKESNLKEREGIAGTQFDINQNRAFASVLPDMDAAKNQGIKAMRDDPDALLALGIDPKKGTRNTRSQDAYNATLGAVQSAAVTRYPYLAQSEALKNYLGQLDRYKPTSPPNMAVMMNQPAPAGGGAALAEQVQAGNLIPKDAISSILNNRQLSPQGKQKELIEYSKTLPTLGGKYTGPQLATFSKNASDPTFNRTAAAIDAVTPNIDALIKLSDQYGRLNIPMLNKAIEAGDFNLGGQTITNMNQLQKIIAEEAGKVFGGSATSDFKIKLGDQMLDLGLGQQNFRSNAMQLKTAMINKKRAMNDAAGPFSIWKDDPDLKPAGGRGGASPQSVAPVAGAKGPLSKGEAHWYLDQAGNDVDKAKAMAQRDGRTF